MDERTPLDQDNQLLYAFLNRKKTRDNQAAMTAQRLVNLFRQLPSFNPEFVAQYNQMLLGANDEIQMMLQDIVGGPTVRQYLTYLQQAYGQAVNEQEGGEKASVSSVNTGYLPSADDDTPFYKTALGFGEAAPKPSSEPIVTIQDFTKWQKSQEALIKKAMMAQNKAISKLALALSEKKHNADTQPISPLQSAYPQPPINMQQPLNFYVNQSAGNNLQSDLTQFEEPNPVIQNSFSSSDNAHQPVLSENTTSSEASETAETVESFEEPTAFESFEEPAAAATDTPFALLEESVEAPESFEEPAAAAADTPFALPEEPVEPAESFEEPAATTDTPFALPEEPVKLAESFEEPATVATDTPFALPEESVEAPESFEEPATVATDTPFALPEEPVEAPESFEPPEIIPELSFDAPNFSTTNIPNENQHQPAALPSEKIPVQPMPQTAMSTPDQPAQPENHLKPAMPSVSPFKNLATKAPIPSALGNLFKFPKMPGFKPMPNLKPMGMPSQPSNQSSLPNETRQSNGQSEMKNQGGN